MAEVDVRAYLQDKGVRIREVPASNEIHVPCWYCGEDEHKRGRLYINVDSSPPGLFSCKLCGESGAFNKIRKHFGDAALDDDGNPFGAKPDNDLLLTNYRLYKDAAEYYHQSLTDQVYSWLKTERGLKAETIVAKKLGYADGTLRTHLEGLGHKHDALVASGLFTAAGVESLAGMVTIPFISYGSQVITIRGKQIGGKYKSLPGSQNLPYNIDSIRGADEVVVTEGEFDALVVEQLGYATMGIPGAQNWKDSFVGYLAEAKRVYICFDNDVAGNSGADKLIASLSPKGRKVEMPPADPGEPKNDPSEWIVKKGHTAAEFRALLMATKSDDSILVGVQEAYEAWTHLEGDPDRKGISTGFEQLDAIIEPGFMPGQVMVILARTGVGKALRDDQRVATPDGWKPIGSLVEGDMVIGSSGKPIMVEGVYPQGIRPMFEVTFSDGVKVVCDEDHLWTVRNKHGSERTVPLKDLIKSGLTYSDGQRFVFVPVIQPVEYSFFQTLPIDPYLLGVLIGDGSFMAGSITFSSMDREIIEKVEEKVGPLGLTVKYAGQYDYRISGKGGSNPLIRSMKSLGLWGKRSEHKFIPDLYMRASVDDRVSLLRGLMDTDGHSGNSPEFSSSSKVLADQVAELVWSLGGVTGWSGKGVRVKSTTHLDHYRVTMTLPMCPFSLPRKVDKWKYKTPTRAMISIRETVPSHATCIKVDANDSLFATEGFVLTHNTIALINMFHRMLNDSTKKIMFVSLEQTRNEWFERAMRVYKFYNLTATTKDVIDYYSGRFMIVDKNRVTEDELVGCVNEFEYELGSKPDVIAVDYLGYWARAFKGEAYERTGAAIMSIKKMAKDLQIPIITPHQVSRAADSARIALTDARDSGAVEETADFLFGLSPVYNTVPDDSGRGATKSVRSSQVALDILKSRHGGVGREIKFTWAPISLVLTPGTEGLMARRAQNEYDWTERKDTPDEVILRHRTGVTDIDPKWVERALEVLEARGEKHELRRPSEG